ncbi:MAG: hypothetical protein ABIL25_04125 [candidate division WOR-3 bacterium]
MSIFPFSSFSFPFSYGRQLAAGVYFCRVEANTECRQRKMVVVR